MIFSLSTLGGCGLLTIKDTSYIDPWIIKEEENGWYYYVSKRSDVKDYEEHAVILGLVDETIECDELVVPETLGGYKVKVFGASHSSMWAETKYYKFNAINVNCLVFNNAVSLMPSVFDNYNGMVMVNCDIYSTDTFDYVRSGLLLKLNYIRYNGMGGELSTYALFWHDNRLIPKPKDPIRDGYVFDGWYTDKEYTIVWDFNNDIITGGMTLYAKWIEQ